MTYLTYLCLAGDDPGHHVRSADGRARHAVARPLVSGLRARRRRQLRRRHYLPEPERRQSALVIA